MTILMSALYVILVFFVVWCIFGFISWCEYTRFWRSIK
jgi:hypothetical protein